MRYVSLLICLLLLIQVNVISQSCLPEGIMFTTQAQIDNFQLNYPGCTEIEGDVEISGNNITNLNGLNVLISICGYLKIIYNSALTSLTGLDNISTIGGYLAIYDNDALTSLTGLESISSIQNHVLISYNYNLICLTGLDNISSIGGDFRIRYNNSLLSITELINVTSIMGRLMIYGNDSLINLKGLDNVSTIGGSFSIYDNDALTSLSGLDNMVSVGGGLSINNNDILTSLSGLDNIDAASIDNLYIIDNPSLSTCEVQSICDYLIGPTGTIQIYNNAPGCNSVEEVEEACLVSVENINPDKISIFPNPAKRQLTISNKNGAIKEVIIYNQTGQIVLHQKPANNTIDISHLHPGMYFVEVVVDKNRIREKIIKE